MAEIALAAVGLVPSVFSSLISFLDLCKKDENCPVETLKLNIDRGWKVLQMVGEYQLQGNEISEVQDGAIKTLTQWCYDAEDLLEENKLRDGGTSISKIWQNITKPDEILAACNDIKEMLTALKDGIQQPNTNPNLINGTYDKIGLDNLIGRGRDVKHIIEVLVSFQERGSNGISIVGMCGIGKTLLARTILKDPRIVNQFNHISLVEAKDGKFVWDDMEKEITQHQACTSSQNEKFLVLIENLQDMDLLEWNKFQKFRKYQSMDVTIMVTTRNPTISGFTGTSLYNLGTLTDDWCIEVIKENAKLQYAKESTSYHLDQEKEKLIAVARKCEGLPLAAKMFGLIIGNFKNVKDWDDFMKFRKLSEVSQFKKEIFPTLVSSSYKNLNTELWRCFAYLSLFPSGHHFDIEDLVHLWVGECFVPFQDKSSLKEIRNKYIDDLKQRSIILESSDQTSNKIFKLHSLGEDIALSASSKTCLRIRQDEDVCLSHRNLRHLSLFFNPMILAQVEKEKRNLRTFLSLHDEINSGRLEPIRNELLKAILRVRVLSLKGTNITQLPSSIGELNHLRYLNISFTRVRELPTDFRKLKALQFLKVKGTPISSLPKGFHNLTDVVYVDWDESYLKPLQRLHKIGCLSRLENLPLFKAGEKEGYMVSELKQMNKLQGSLHIQNLEMVKDTNVANQAMLHNKDELTKVGLQWCAISEHAEDVLSSLKPHANVKELKLMNYRAKCPDWIKDSSLEKIDLFNCSFCNFIPVLGRLKNLKTLVLEYMSSEHISVDDDADPLFPELESLEFHCITGLKSMSGLRPQDMPQLKHVTVSVDGSPSFDDLPTFIIQHKLQTLRLI